MRIIGLLRVKNGEPYIERHLKQVTKICEMVLVLNDGSTDNTEKICKTFENVRVHTQHLPFHGGRDRIFLHEWAKAFNPEWVLALDVDEFFEEGMEGLVRLTALNSSLNTHAWQFPFFYMWGDEGYYRADGQYEDVKVLRLFRYSPDELPDDTPTHSTAAPASRRCGEFLEVAHNIRVKHLGYITPELRQEKYDHYTKRDSDPLKAGAGSKDYNHIIQTEGVLIKEWNNWKAPVKLNIGCKTWKPGGYYHIDIDNHLLEVVGGEDLPLDMIADGGKLSEIADESVDELYVGGLVQHCSNAGAFILVKELHRVLKKDAYLYMHVEDIREVCEDLIKSIDEDGAELISKNLMRIFGSQKKLSDFHYSGWTGRRVKGVLDSVGFKTIAIPSCTGGIRLRCQK